LLARALDVSCGGDNVARGRADELQLAVGWRVDPNRLSREQESGRRRDVVFCDGSEGGCGSHGVEGVDGEGAARGRAVDEGDLLDLLHEVRRRDRTRGPLVVPEEVRG